MKKVALLLLGLVGTIACSDVTVPARQSYEPAARKQLLSQPDDSDLETPTPGWAGHEVGDEGSSFDPRHCPENLVGIPSGLGYVLLGENEHELNIGVLVWKWYTGRYRRSDGMIRYVDCGTGKFITVVDF